MLYSELATVLVRTEPAFYGKICSSDPSHAQIEAALLTELCIDTRIGCAYGYARSRERIAHFAHLSVESGMTTRTKRKRSCHQLPIEAIASRSLNRLLEKERARLFRINRTALGMVKRLVWNVLKPLRSPRRRV
jgi:hypothetical protein